MKLIVTTGKETHTSSYASLRIKFKGGKYDGLDLYEVRDFKVRVNWDEDNDQHANWADTEYELPEGTRIAVIGVTGSVPRDRKKHKQYRVYQLDPSAEMLEEEIDVELRSCLVKGRLTRIIPKENEPIDYEGGFEEQHGAYKPIKVKGGWRVAWMEQDKLPRLIDGSILYKAKQPAQVKATKLNHMKSEETNATVTIQQS